MTTSIMTTANNDQHSLIIDDLASLQFYRFLTGREIDIADTLFFL